MALLPTPIAWSGDVVDVLLLLLLLLPEGHPKPDAGLHPNCDCMHHNSDKLTHRHTSGPYALKAWVTAD